MSELLLNKVIDLAVEVERLRARVEALESRPSGPPADPSALPPRVVAAISAIAADNPDLTRHLQREARAWQALGLEEGTMIERLRVGTR